MKWFSLLLLLALTSGCGEKPTDYISLYVENLGSSDPAMRYSAARSLGTLGSEGRDGVPALIVALRDSDPTVRAAAARSLAAIGRDAAPAFPQLVKMLDDKDRDVRMAALAALPAMGAQVESATAAIQRRAAADADKAVRASATKTLQQMQIAKKYRQTASQ
jgi:HEAT repeat protein